MKINIDFNERLTKGLIGLAAIALSLILGSFVTTNLNFEQVLLGGFACASGLVGVIALIGAVFNVRDF